jgi:hypothetical protein
MSSFPTVVSLIVALVLLLVTVEVWRRWREALRADYIRAYMFPPGLFAKLAERRPGLVLKDQQLVARALRQFFLAHLKSGRKFVSMPSQVADDLWHEFILYTRHYQEFCTKAFGRFLHHTPAVALTADKQNNTGLRRVWWHACLEENINPRTPTRLPLLFALDEKLKVEGGFRYVPDCSGVRREGEKGGSGGTPYCGGDFSSSDFDGSTDGFGDGDGGDGGSCGGGCGGD